MHPPSALVLLAGLVACGVAFEEGVASSGGGGSSDGAGASTGGSPVVGGAGGSPNGGATAVGGRASNGGGGQIAMGGSPPLMCPSPNTVCCGGAPCPIPEMECCAVNQNLTQQAQCVPAGTCPSEQLTIQCDDSEDCGGDYCCSTWTGSQHTQIVCAAVCTPPAQLGSAGNYRMCSLPNGNCPAAQSCNTDCCVGDIGIGYCN